MFQFECISSRFWIQQTQILIFVELEKNGFFTFSGQSYFLLTLYQYLVYISTSPLILWSFQLICGTSFNFQNFFPLHRSFFYLACACFGKQKAYVSENFLNWHGLSVSADFCIHFYGLNRLRQASQRKKIESSALRLKS